MPHHDVGDLAQRRPGADPGVLAAECGHQVGEQPGPPQAAAADHDAVAAGPAHHPQRVVGRPDVAVAQHRDLGDGVLEAGDGLPVGGPAVVLRRRTTMQGDGGDALLHRDPPGVQEGQMIVVDALAHLHRHRPAARVVHRLVQDGPQQRSLVRQRGAAALAGHLRDGAAEVEVDVVGEVLVGDHAHRLADGHRVDAVELDGARLLARVEVHELHRLLVALHQRPRGDHLTDEQAPAAGELPAQRPERRVGDPGHRRQHDRRLDSVLSDVQRLDRRAHTAGVPRLVRRCSALFVVVRRCPAWRTASHCPPSGDGHRRSVSVPAHRPPATRPSSRSTRAWVSSSRGTYVPRRAPSAGPSHSPW